MRKGRVIPISCVRKRSFSLPLDVVILDYSRQWFRHRHGTTVGTGSSFLDPLVVHTITLRSGRCRLGCNTEWNENPQVRIGLVRRAGNHFCLRPKRSPTANERRGRGSAKPRKEKEKKTDTEEGTGTQNSPLVARPSLDSLHSRQREQTFL